MEACDCEEGIVIKPRKSKNCVNCVRANGKDGFGPKCKECIAKGNGEVPYPNFEERQVKS